MNICSPQEGQTFTERTVLVSAAASSNPPIKVMEVWAEGRKRFSIQSNKISGVVTFSGVGTQVISVWATDANSQKYNKKVTINIDLPSLPE